jgi:hypothetical protein
MEFIEWLRTFGQRVTSLQKRLQSGVKNIGEGDREFLEQLIRYKINEDLHSTVDKEQEL